MKLTTLDPVATDAVAALAVAADALAGEDREGWSNAARSAQLEELLAARERVDAEVLRALAAWEPTGAWLEEGAPSPAGWLVEHAALTRRDAADLLRSARLLRDHARTAKSLAAGDLSAANVAILARAVRHREPVFDEQEDVLLDAAEQLPPEQFRTLARRWQSLADDHLDRAGRTVDQNERWHLHASTTFDGAVALHGLLDPEGGAIVLAALDAHDRPDPTSGDRPPRSQAQRRADALVALCGGGVRAQVNLDVVVDLATLDGASPTDLESFRREITGIGPIGQATLERLACDCRVGRVVMRGRSVPLDLGRRTPVVSAAQRRVLALRDGGCVTPGCGAPAASCDAHHRIPWAEGGATDLDNLELRCRRCHIAEHEGRRGRATAAVLELTGRR